MWECIRFDGSPKEQHWGCDGIYQKTSYETAEGHPIWKNEYARYLYWTPRVGGRWQCATSRQYLHSPTSYHSQETAHGLPTIGGNFKYGDDVWHTHNGVVIEEIECPSNKWFTLETIQEYIDQTSIPQTSTNMFWSAARISYFEQQLLFVKSIKRKCTILAWKRIYDDIRDDMNMRTWNTRKHL